MDLPQLFLLWTFVRNIYQNVLAQAVEVRCPGKILKEHSEPVSPALGLRTLDARWSSGKDERWGEISIIDQGELPEVQWEQKDRRMLCHSGSAPLLSMTPIPEQKSQWLVSNLTPCALNSMWLDFTQTLLDEPFKAHVGHVLDSGQEYSLVCFCFVKCWLFKRSKPSNRKKQNLKKNPWSSQSEPESRGLLLAFK